MKVSPSEPMTWWQTEFPGAPIERAKTLTPEVRAESARLLHEILSELSPDDARDRAVRALVSTAADALEVLTED